MFIYISLEFIRVPTNNGPVQRGCVATTVIKCRVLYISHSCVDTFEQVTTRCRNKTIRTMQILWYRIAGTE